MFGSKYHTQHKDGSYSCSISLQSVHPPLKFWHKTERQERHSKYDNLQFTRFLPLLEEICGNLLGQLVGMIEIILSTRAALIKLLCSFYSLTNY